MAREIGKGRYKKAKGAREVSISQTSWKKDTGAGPKGQAGRLVGPRGQLFTGTVKMSDGTKVVYEKGKRVTRQTTAGGGVTPAQANAAKKTGPLDKTKDTPKDESKVPPPPPPPSLRGGKYVSTTTISGVEKASNRKFKTQPPKTEKETKTTGKINTQAQMPKEAAAVVSAKEKKFKDFVNKKRGPYTAQPQTPQARLNRIKKSLAFQNTRKRQIEAKKRKTAQDAANLRKINAEIARLKKSLG